MISHTHESLSDWLNWLRVTTTTTSVTDLQLELLTTEWVTLSVSLWLWLWVLLITVYVTLTYSVTELLALFNEKRPTNGSSYLGNLLFIRMYDNRRVFATQPAEKRWNSHSWSWITSSQASVIEWKASRHRVGIRQPVTMAMGNTLSICRLVLAM